MPKVAAEVRTIARGVERLPPFPQVAHRLVEAMRDPQTDAAGLARLIELDPTLSVALLRLVNSPFFGMARRIGSLHETVLVLGLRTVQRLVLSTAVVRPYRSAGSSIELWREQIRCAVLARALTPDPIDADMAFTAGLLHDLGGLAIELTWPEQKGVADRDAESGKALVLAERDAVGFDHAEMGAALLAHWQLPDVVIDAVRRHHDASAASAGPVVHAVWLANQHQRAVFSGALPELPSLPLSPAAIASVRREVEGLEALLR